MANSVRQRRTFLKSQKHQILKEHIDKGLSLSLLSRKYQISSNTHLSMEEEVFD